MIGNSLRFTRHFSPLQKRPHTHFSIRQSTNNEIFLSLCIKAQIIVEQNSEGRFLEISVLWFYRRFENI